MHDPVERAVVANELMWSSRVRRGEYRKLRAAAVAAAIEAGRPAEEVATRLGVKAADLGWITEADTGSWSTCP